METVMMQDAALDPRGALLNRRQRLESVIAGADDARSLAALLDEVDAALARIDRGTFGICDVCHDPIEIARMNADPLVRTCLSCLSPDERRALEKDLDLAWNVQQRLLPPRSVRVGGWEAAFEYEPAGSAGGDYLDVIPLDNGELVFLIGDVSGKGVAASLLMSHLHATIRSLIALGLPFRELLPRANRMFHEAVGGQHYATLICGKADPSGTIELANAGHWPPIVIQNGRQAMLPPTSVPLGLFSHAPFPTTRTMLNAGDSIVLYTDGVTETLDASGREYGRDRLLLSIGCQDRQPLPALVSRCLTDVATFRGTVPRRDDATLFMLRRDGAGEAVRG